MYINIKPHPNISINVYAKPNNVGAVIDRQQRDPQYDLLSDSATFFTMHIKKEF